MYALDDHPKYFKFKRKYQQYGPCFQTIFPFLMTMLLLENSANIKCHPVQVKINCSKSLIDGLQQRHHMNFLVSLFVTSRNLLFGVFLPKKIITISQKIPANFLKGVFLLGSILGCFGKIF